MPFERPTSVCTDDVNAKNNADNIMTTNQKTSLLILLVLSALVATYFLLNDNTKQLQALKKQVAPTISLYPISKPLADLPLIDDQRNIVSLSLATNNKWSILYFGYTSCPDVCPIDLAILNQTLGLMKQAGQVQVIFVSVDPQRDIGKLADFATHFNKSFIGLSAKDNVLTQLTKSLGVYHEVAQTKQKAAVDHAKMDHSKMNNNYLIDHTASYLLLNPQLELTGLLTNPHKAGKMANALDLIIEKL